MKKESISIVSRMDKERLAQIEALYLKAFPKEERKPFSLILEKVREGRMEILSIEGEEAEFAGLAILIYVDEIVWLDYFAICEHMRGGGIGSAALQALLERYGDKKFLLEIESTKVECDDLEMRKRRKAFYLSNGLKEAGLDVWLFQVDMEILTNGYPVDFAQYYHMYEETFGKEMRERGKISDFVKEA